MGTNINLLSWLIWLPVAGGCLTLALGEGRPSAARWLSMLVSVATFGLSIPLYTGFRTGTAQMQFVERAPWIPSFNAQYYLGVDGIAMPLILLTTFITVITLIAGWSSVHKRISQYCASFLIMEGLMIGVFAALDGLLAFFRSQADQFPQIVISTQEEGFYLLPTDPRDGSETILLVEGANLGDPETFQRLQDLQFELQLTDGVASVYSLFALREPPTDDGDAPLVVGDAGLGLVFRTHDSHRPAARLQCRLSPRPLRQRSRHRRRWQGRRAEPPLREMSRCA